MQVMHNINSGNIDQLSVVKQYENNDQVMHKTIRYILTFDKQVMHNTIKRK